MLGLKAEIRVSPPLEKDQVEIKVNLVLTLPVGTRLELARHLRNAVDKYNSDYNLTEDEEPHYETKNLFASPEGLTQFLMSVLPTENAIDLLIKRLLSYQPGDDGLDNGVLNNNPPDNKWL